MSGRRRPWWFTAAGQAVLATVPGAGRLTDRVRRRRVYLTDEYLLSKWAHVERHLKAADGSVRGLTVVEIGTGWFPVVPLGLALHGAEVLTVDRDPHLEQPRTALTLERVLTLAEDGRLTLPEGAVDRGRQAQASPGADGADALAALRSLGVRALLGDAARLSDLPQVHGADLLVSNNTLEHLPPEVLQALFTGFARLASPTARMSHYVDLADHFSYTDPRVGEFHFLGLPDRVWRLANRGEGYQNRLRIHDYRSLLAQTGWRVTREHNQRRDAAELDRVDLAPRYAAVEPHDLLVVKSHLVTRRS